MGMFDYVKYECVCPVCGDSVDGFQTKDKDCILDLIQPQEVSNFYTHCLSCDMWIEFDRVSSTSFKMTIEGNDRNIIEEHTKIVGIK